MNLARMSLAFAEVSQVKLGSRGCCQSSSTEPMILPKVGVIIGVANINARFVAIVGSN